MIAEYVVRWDFDLGLEQFWCTYSYKAGRAMRRAISKALPKRQTELEALRDLQAWLEMRLARGDNYSQIGRQITRVAGEIAMLQRETNVPSLMVTTTSRALGLSGTPRRRRGE